MKLNQTLILTAFVAASVLAGGSLVQAQDAPTNPPSGAPGAPPSGAPGAPPQMRSLGGFNMISRRLNLTDDQKPKVQPIIEDMAKQVRELRADTSLSPEDKRAKQKGIRDATTAKLKDILTPDQFAAWEKMGPGNRRPPGAPAMTPPASAPSTNSSN